MMLYIFLFFLKIANGNWIYNDYQKTSLNARQVNYFNDYTEGSQNFDTKEDYKQQVENAFSVINEWKFLDFKYPTFDQRRNAIRDRRYIPENNLPLGVDFHENRIFLTTPRWKDGVPASLGTLDYPPKERSPAIKPYPSWNAHADPYLPDCNKLISVYRTYIDICDRLWAIDSGVVNATGALNQICPPKIVAFDLKSDELIILYNFPSNVIKEESLHSNIIVDVKNNQCNNAFVYVTDVWRFGIIVYSLLQNRSWRVTNYQFSPNPVAANFNLYGLNFQWLDGVFGMSLLQHENDTTLYFHPMASFKEFAVNTDLLNNETIWTSFQDVSQEFQEIGDRGLNGQSSTSGITRNGIMLFTQVHRDNIGCWDTKKPYLRSNIALLGNQRQSSSSQINFPNDLKIDKAAHQGVWVISNRLPRFLYSKLNYEDVNFKLLYANIDQLTSNTVCNPNASSKVTDGLALVPLREGQCY